MAKVRLPPRLFVTDAIAFATDAYTANAFVDVVVVIVLSVVVVVVG